MLGSVGRPQARLCAVFMLTFVALNPVLASSEFALGVDVFMAHYGHILKGQRVGLITNHTGKNAGGHATIDLLHQHPDVNLVALFAPEHGIRGVIKAGEHFQSSRDPETGLPIYSLYGGHDHRPPKAVIDTLDTLVYDIQDVGSRAYTYIWTLAEALAAMGEQGKSIVVFDRPNPMGGVQIDGPVTEDRWRSFLGLYPIPRVYGTTVGEIARYFNAEHKLHCRLVVIPMAGYKRPMTWAETGLTWTGPSPNIPSVESAICFAATGTLGVLGNLHIGIGTDYPFQLVGAPWLDASAAADLLNQYRLPGVIFQATQFTLPTGLYRGDTINAVFLRVVAPASFLPATTELVILHHLQQHYPKHFKWNPKKFNGFDKAMGTSAVRTAIMRGDEPGSILAGWRHAQAEFQQRLEPYRIYR